MRAGLAKFETEDDKIFDTFEDFQSAFVDGGGIVRECEFLRHDIFRE